MNASVSRRFRWIGGPTFELTLGRFRLLSDPVFGSGAAAFFMNGHPSTGEERAAIARAGALPDVRVEGLDLVLVSHLHSDHFDPVARELLPHSTPVVAPSPQTGRIRQWGFGSVRGLGWGDAWSAERSGERLEIVAVPARHAADDATNEMLGVVNGYVITHLTDAGRYSLYWTGDTVWFDGLEEIRRTTGDHDLLIPHVGAVGRGGPWGRMTLDAVEGARLMRLFRGARTIPVHHHTFSHYVEPVEALVAELEGTPCAARLKVLAEGESAALEASVAQERR